MATYSKELKNNLVTRMFPPGNKSISSLSRETGISKMLYVNGRRKHRKMVIITTGNKSVEQWSS